MARTRERGIRSKVPARRASNGFVNRRSPVQGRASAPDSQKHEFTAESAAVAVRGYRVGTVSARRASAALAWLIRNSIPALGGVP